MTVRTVTVNHKIDPDEAAERVREYLLKEPE